MKRAPTIVIGALACAISLPAAGEGRLVEACRVAVTAHADGVVLAFPEASQSGQDVRLRFTFENSGKTHSGTAFCSFAADTRDGQPPSLDGFDIMGKGGASMFLISNHAIWRHFTGAQIETPAARPDSPARPPRPTLRRPIA